MPRQLLALDLRFPPLADRPDLPDLLAAALDDLGVAAVHEAGDDDQPVWRVFLRDQARVTGAAEALRADWSSSGCAVDVVTVDDEDWAARSQAALRHVTIDGLIVAPPWDVPGSAGPETRVIVIQPSMGFGTGHHESTRLCLRLLQRLDVRGRRVIDVGTGSGVLAIAAARLGAGSVEGVDFDEDALHSARENVALNGVGNAVSLRQADIRSDRLEPADLLFANLTGALLIAQSDSLLRLVRPGGALIVSGYQDIESDHVVSSFAPRLSQVTRLTEHDWEALLGLL